jgi:hypothetical protein
MIRQPSGVIDGVALGQYQLGRRYDLPSSLAQYLVAQGFALLEMRCHARSSRPRARDRRKRPLASAPRTTVASWHFDVGGGASETDD